MTNKITPRSIREELQNLRFENTFNPYADICSRYDEKRSAEYRAMLLETMLDAASDTEIDAIWLGRDLGYRGGRRTGLALTDDINFGRHVARWELKAERPTKGPPVKERTAEVIWDMLSQIQAPIFLWNVFPLHPFEPEKYFSNRSHNRRERREGERVLSLIVSLLRPQRIVAIGNDAAKSAQYLFPYMEVNHVRHPSYGGQRQFCEQICDLYAIDGESGTQELPF